jgi:crotonobetainyl-CoA:carnitine CoA-transferase CaiB-like acyl-CoA transferase
MGFGYEVLKKLNPRIIMVNVSAYGQFGPYRERIGIDHIGQALGGATMVTGQEGMPPMLSGVAVMDRTTALTATIGTLSALYEREASGEGQSIDVCLADTGYSYTEIPISAYLGGGMPPKRGESARPGSGIFPCKEGWVLLSVTLQNGWPRFCDALRKPEWLEDPRFSTGRERNRNKDLVNAALKELLSTMTMKEAVEHFSRYDVVAAPCNDIPQAAADSHPWERGALVEVPDFQAGTIVVSGDYWHFSRTPAVIGSAPKVGEHNEEILTSLLGYSAEQIEQLRETQVIGEWDHYSDVREEVSVL